MRKLKWLILVLVQILVCVLLSHPSIAEWVTEPVGAPTTQLLIVKGDIMNFGEAFQLMTGRDIRKYTSNQWTMQLIIANPTNASATLSLSECAIVTPKRLSYPLSALTKGKLPSSIPPGAVGQDIFSLPNMTISSGDVVSLYLVWYDPTGRHEAYWAWSLKYIPDEIQKTQTPQPVPQQQRTPRKRFVINWWIVGPVLIGLWFLGMFLKPQSQ